MGAQADQELTTARLVLTPLVASDAEAMAAVLNDPVLWTHTGGEPETAATFRRRAADRAPGHLNWVVRAPEVAGYVQATVEGTGDGTGDDTVAWLAWVIGTGHQGHGYAAEAAGAVRDHLAMPVRAAISDANAASEAVARALGLLPTAERVDGERIWRQD